MWAARITDIVPAAAPATSTSAPSTSGHRRLAGGAGVSPRAVGESDAAEREAVGAGAGGVLRDPEIRAIIIAEPCADSLPNGASAAASSDTCWNRASGCFSRQRITIAANAGIDAGQRRAADRPRPSPPSR